MRRIGVIVDKEFHFQSFLKGKRSSKKTKYIKITGLRDLFGIDFDNIILGPGSCMVNSRIKKKAFQLINKKYEED